MAEGATPAFYRPERRPRSAVLYCLVMTCLCGCRAAYRDRALGTLTTGGACEGCLRSLPDFAVLPGHPGRANLSGGYTLSLTSVRAGRYTLILRCPACGARHVSDRRRVGDAPGAEACTRCGDALPRLSVVTRATAQRVPVHTFTAQLRARLRRPGRALPLLEVPSPDDVLVLGDGHAWTQE